MNVESTTRNSWLVFTALCGIGFLENERLKILLRMLWE
jgi:hypothetical protein